MKMESNQKTNKPNKGETKRNNNKDITEYIKE